METTSHWLATSPAPEFPQINRDLHVDVLVVGGGITGVTAAYLLKKAGKSVTLLERDRIGCSQTGHTTAHLTYVTDTRLTELAKTFGESHAQAAWEANARGGSQLEEIVRTEGIECHLHRAPAYLYAAVGKDTEKEAESLREEAELASKLGFDAAYLESAPLVGRPAVRFANQARFHPHRYVSALAQCIPGDGCHVFEHSSVAEISDDPRQATAEGYTVSFDWLILATHVPLQGKTSMVNAALLQTKLAAYSTYAVGAKVPTGQLPLALFWDTNDPYFYLRVDRGDGHDYAVLGGEDHKTGQKTDTEACFLRLEEQMRKLCSEAAIDCRWSGQVIEPTDGLPYIGEIAERQFVATGFAGNGTTFGTLAAIMARDAVTGVPNPWRDLFSVERKKLSALWDYLLENKDYPFYLLKDQLAGAEAQRLDEVPPGEGKIVRLHGKKLAIHRDANGHVTSLSAVCPHMGCTVHWNAAEETWDCPCHGSRFAATGGVIAGPAESDLAEKELRA